MIERTVDLPAGRLHYREFGPPQAATATSAPPVVLFVHGLLTDGRLWHPVAAGLADRGLRSLVADWPLGSHREPMARGADLSPPGLADLVAAFAERLGPAPVILVGNDTGGAVCQYVVDRHAGLLAGLVLTDCDAFENFPPPLFRPLFLAGRYPRLAAGLLQLNRLRAVRHSPLAYGTLLPAARHADLLASWLAPATADAAIRRDLATLCRGVDPRDLTAVGSRLHQYPGPVHLVWGETDRNFPLRSAQRLRDAFAHAELTTVPGARTFFPLDDPEPVIEAIAGLAAR